MKRALVIALVLLLGSVFGAFALLVGTQWGLERAFAVARAALPGELRVQRLSGRLLGPVELDGLEYVEDGLSLALGRGRIDWTPRALAQGELRLTELTLSDVDVALTSAGGPKAAAPSLPAIRFPLAVAIEDARLSPLRVRADSAAPIVIDEIALAASARADALEIERLEIRGYDAQLETSGALRLAAPHPLKLRIRWRYSAAGLAPLRGEGEVAGDLARLRIAQQLEGAVTAKVEAELSEPLTVLRWRAQVQLERFEAQRVSADWPEVSAAGRLAAQGDLATVSAAGRLRARVPVIGDLSADLDLLFGDGALDIRRLRLEQTPSAARVEVSGRWRPGSEPGALALEGRWEGLTWPLRAPEAARPWQSPAGQFSVDGTLKEYRLRVSAAVEAAGLPAARVEARGAGDAQALQLDELKIATLGGHIAGTARLAWAPAPGGEATLSFSDIDPGRRWPEWPGRLGGRLVLRGSLADGTPSARLELARLDGTLRDSPIEGRARLRLEGETLSAERLTLALGEARLALDGSIGERWDLRWRIDAPDLASVWPGAAGTLAAHGALSGPRLAPHIVGSLRGRSLAWHADRAAALTAEVDVDLAADNRFALSVQAEGIDARGMQWSQARLSGKGSAREHRLDLAIEGHDRFLRGGLDGAFDEAGLAWAGQLSRLALRLPELGEWELAQASGLRLARDSAHLDTLCLTQSEARLCAGGDWKAGTAIVSADGRALPLQLLSNWLPVDTQLAGRAAVEARIVYGARGVSEGRAVLTGSEVEVSRPELAQPLRFGAIVLRGDLDAAGASASAIVPLASGGRFTAAVELPGWRAPEPLAAGQPVAGELRAEDLPLELIGRFTSALGGVQGKLQAQFALAGTAAAPRVSGNARLEDGAADLPLLGIRLSEVRGEVTSEEGLRLRYDFSARSGEGSISLRGRTELEPQAGWPTRLEIGGERVQVVNLPEARVEVTPSVTIRIAGRDVMVEGEVAVPYARLRPRKLPEGTVSASRDVVVVGSSGEPVVEERWRLRTRLRVSLGERVDFDGFGVRGRLVGNLLLIDEPGKLTVGQGEVGIVDGVYQMRGQDLSIRRGRLIFANSLIDDPGVDVEAVRVVSDVTAGVRVRGTLKRPALTVFSEPAMAESDALSYLLIGRPLQEASAGEGERMQQAALAAGLIGGDLLAREVGGRLGLDEIRVEAGETAERTALVMGKYLTPKLYVRYLTGIVETSNIVQLRYQLTRRIQVQTEGGYRGNQNVSGGDVFYTFEH